MAIGFKVQYVVCITGFYSLKLYQENFFLKNCESETANVESKEMIKLVYKKKESTIKAEKGYEML